MIQRNRRQLCCDFPTINALLPLSGPRPCRISFVVAIVATTLTYQASPARSEYRYDVVVSSDETAPFRDRDYFLFGPPSINASGVVAFEGELRRSPHSPSNVAFVASVEDGIRQVGSDDFLFLGESSGHEEPIAIDSSGSAIYFGVENGRRSIYRGDSLGTLKRVVSDGSLISSDTRISFLSEAFDVSANGTIAFVAGLEPLNSPTERYEALLTADPAGQIRKVARIRGPVPGRTGSLRRLTSLPHVNDSGHVAFNAIVDIGSLSVSESAVYLGTTDDTLKEVARRDVSTPDGSEEFIWFNTLDLNSNGLVTFEATTATVGVQGTSRTVYRSDEDLGLVQVAKSGFPTPDGSGVFETFSSTVISDNGDVAFVSNAISNDGQREFDGIYKEGSDGSLVHVAQSGDALPDGGGSFRSLWDLSTNATGQVVFRGSFSGPGIGVGENAGIFSFDEDTGVTEVVRLGDPLLGSVISTLTLNDGASLGTSLNDRGQIAFSYRLADGRAGVAIASRVPEPQSVTLLSLIGVVASLRLRIKNRLVLHPRND